MHTIIVPTSSYLTRMVEDPALHSLCLVMLRLYKNSWSGIDDQRQESPSDEMWDEARPLPSSLGCGGLMITHLSSLLLLHKVLALRCLRAFGFPPGVVQSEGFHLRSRIVETGRRCANPAMNTAGLRPRPRQCLIEMPRRNNAVVRINVSLDECHGGQPRPNFHRTLYSFGAQYCAA